MGKKKPGVNIVTHPDGWAVRRDSSGRANRVFPTQREAIKYGRPIARRDEAELRIQDRNSRRRDSDSDGNDPIPPLDQQH
jgi:hypothetical protein